MVLKCPMKMTRETGTIVDLKCDEERCAWWLAYQPTQVEKASTKGQCAIAELASK